MAGQGAGRAIENVTGGKDDPNRLGNKLRRAREKMRISQIELAKASGYSNGWISAVERGDASPTGTFVRRMERVLGVDLGYLDVVSARRQRGKKGDVGDWGLSVSEAAGYVGLSRTRLYELIREGELETVGVDGFKRLRIVDVCAWAGEDEDELREWLREKRGTDIARVK